MTGPAVAALNARARRLGNSGPFDALARAALWEEGARFLSGAAREHHLDVAREILLDPAWFSTDPDILTERRRTDLGYPEMFRKPLRWQRKLERQERDDLVRRRAAELEGGAGSPTLDGFGWSPSRIASQTGPAWGPAQPVRWG